MADEPNTPSAEVQTTDAAPSEPSSDSAEEKASESPSWWQRMFHRRGQEQDSEDADGGPQGDTSNRLQLTQEELDRRVQAETDRREAKRNADARVRQRKELRDSDPWAYAEEDRKAEEEQQSTGQLQQFLTGLSGEHDRVAIDPLIELLPQADRDRILRMEGAGTGLKGRKLLVTEAVKALEKHWKAEGQKDAERKLRGNPAFRKQVLAEGRGQTVEPELLPALSASEADDSVNGILRNFYGLPNPKRHNEAS